MKFMTTPTSEYETLAKINTETVFDYIDQLIENPEKAVNIPDGAVVVVPTEDEWVNQKNQEMAKAQISEEGGEIYYWNESL